MTSAMFHTCEGVKEYAQEVGWYIISVLDCEDTKEPFFCYDVTRDPDIAKMWFMTINPNAMSNVMFWSTGNRDNPWNRIDSMDQIDQARQRGENRAAQRGRGERTERG